MVNHTLSFSIITPSYNQANYLPLNLESVVKQTYPYVEHLIYDPGSTDGSIDLARDHAQRHKQVKFYNEPDRGQVHAINKGLAVATGDILTWLNSDDYYIDDSVLADVAQYFEEYPDIDVVYGRGYYIGSDGSILRDAFVHKAGNDFQLSLQHSIGIIQPSLFFRR
ncbi:partial heptose III glucuronosyltransferase, partial [Anaerolineae bacterium]